jgi:hypothetical protein
MMESRTRIPKFTSGKAIPGPGSDAVERAIGELLFESDCMKSLVKQKEEGDQPGTLRPQIVR